VGEWGLLRELQALLKGRLAEHVITATGERGGEEDEDKNTRRKGEEGAGSRERGGEKGFPVLTGSFAQSLREILVLTTATHLQVLDSEL